SRRATASLRPVLPFYIKPPLGRAGTGPGTIHLERSGGRSWRTHLGREHSRRDDDVSRHASAARGFNRRSRMIVFLSNVLTANNTPRTHTHDYSSGDYCISG